MKLIVGLGNPGEKYKNNRHNVGYMFVDYLVDELMSSRVYEFKINKYLSSMIYRLESNLLLAKPTTFMNNSGIAVKKLISNLKFKISNLIVVHDDLDIPLGKFHIQSGVGPRLHNGIESIERHLKTKDFLRVRIGVDNRTTDNRIDGERYVLNNFLPEEKNILAKVVFPNIFKQLKILKILD